MFVRRNSEIAPLSDTRRSQERPEQHNCREQEGPMEEVFEIEAGEENKDLMRRQPLR